MNNNESSMRNYENKTKEDLLEIIEQLEKKNRFPFLSFFRFFLSLQRTFS